jgi:hypothetical protein
MTSVLTSAATNFQGNCGTATKVELLREGAFLAEVVVEIVLDGIGWSPGFTPGALKTLERVRTALGDFTTASRYAKIYALRPIATKLRPKIDGRE